MTCVKRIACTLFSLWKAAHSPVFAQLVKAFLPSGQKLMGIRLVSHIPDNLILWQVEDQVHCHRKFHNAQIRCKMSPAFTDLLNQKLPDLFCQQFQFLRFQGFDIVLLLYPL